ncbi:hypothetical protein HAX54_027919 [Datura stramonium]|uniref:Uncharacterized protein n=1 Tax=Datura stramonium TaxID=4076 RepID=A0ABS8Y9X3_DATST|nr:hypothetical protein [Datura stramonium]
MFEQLVLPDFGDSIDFPNTIEYNDLGGGTCEPIIIVPIDRIGDSVATDDKQHDIGFFPSDDTERRLSYDERSEEAQTLDIGVDRNAKVYKRDSKKRKTIPVIDDPISAQSSILFDKNDAITEVAKPVTPTEEEHPVVPEVQTQSEIVKSVQAVKNEVLEPITPMEEKHLVVPEAQTQSKIVKSVQAINKEVPKPVTPMDNQHLVVSKE